MRKVLLLQIRDREDRMRDHEVECFARKLAAFGEVELLIHSLIFDSAPPPADVDVVMVGGSGRYGAVNNHEAWFPSSLDLFRDLIDRNVPLFCSCWGHQALSVALGGEVVRDESRRELGTHQITLTEEGRRDPLFAGFPERFEAQLGHNDHVQRLPRGAVLLASSVKSPIQCYRLEGKPVYATQFHPEMDHLENRQRASGYSDLYEGTLGDELFRETPHAVELIPRFMRLVF